MSKYRRFGDAGAVVAVSAVVAGAYWLTRAPLYNPARSIDPWLYTALWVNFKPIYHAFMTTYYASRLPWVIPGYLANRVLSPRAAYLTVHSVLFFGGALCLYLAVRRYFGHAVGLVAFASLLASQLYYDGHRWDYWDGAITAWLLASLYFALLALSARRLRPVAAAASGGFAMAAAATNLVAVAAVAGVVLMCAVIARRPRARTVLIDAAGFLAGAALVYVACGIFATHYGGQFNFLEPQLRAARTIKGAQYKEPYGNWLDREPRLLVPLFLACVIGILLVARRPPLAARERFAVAALAHVFALYGAFVVWEFAFGGYFLEYTYYFALLTVAIWVALASCAAMILVRVGPVSSILVATVAVGCALAPLVVIYGPDSSALVGTHGLVVSAVAMAVTLGVLVVFVRRPRRGLAVAVLALVVGCCNFSIDSSAGTFVEGVSDPTSGGYFSVGMRLVGYLNHTPRPEPLPVFWYDAKVGNGVLVGLQSLYYYGYSYVGLDLPRVDHDFRNRMRIYHPRTIVLLCQRRTCDGAPAALRRAGFRIGHPHVTLLAASRVRVWVRVYSISM